MKNKVYVNIKECKDGDIIAEDVVIGGINIPIIVKDTIINDNIRNKLLIYNISYLYVLRDMKMQASNEIQQNNFIKEYQNLIEETKSIFANVVKGKKIEGNDIVNITSLIIKKTCCISKVIESIQKMKSFDEYTYTHSLNVALYAMLIGKWLKMSELELNVLIKAGLLHDIGKINIPLSILNKKGKLKEEEFIQIKEHAYIGYHLCNKYSWLPEEVKEAVLSHHEREDGSGYPNGLKGNKISQYAKIIAIVDVYDALTSERVYKSKLNPFDAFKVMRKDGYNKFDVTILDSFFNFMSSIYVRSKVKLNNNKVGEIVFIHPKDIIDPVIKVDNEYYELSKNPDLRITNFL